jgi:mono/diheme cytochrome c family protein
VPRPKGSSVLFSALIAFVFSSPVTAAVPPVDVPDTMAERIKACVGCHGPEDKMARDGYQPRIAGKPEGYLYNQLLHFRDGRRYFRPMALLLAGLSDRYLLEMARYFSSLEQPYPPPERLVLSPGEIDLARKLVMEGDPSRDIPACVECHSEALMGAGQFIPGLLGLPRVYLIAQFGAWRSGGLLRGQARNCMSEIAGKLTAEESIALSGWLAAQPVAGKAKPAGALSPEMTRRCGSLTSMAENTLAPKVQSTTPQAYGAYLARVGNCMGCHTAQGGRPYAGGRRLSTPFGTFVSPNITPDQATGIGSWNEDDFWKALHEGKSRDGRPLYPAFPYTEYTTISREDADAIFTHLKALPPVMQPNTEHKVFFPYNFQPLLSLWRAVYFKPGVFQPDTTRSKEWNRGAYLVQGLGHCNACHAQRNPLGAVEVDKLGGGQIMGSNWYAPSLTSNWGAGSANWPLDEVVRLLTTGVSRQSATSGPMGEVVSQSLQYLTAKDARAMAVYLKSLGPGKAAAGAAGAAPAARTAQVNRWLEHGSRLYEKHCEDCHGASGQGAPGIYPPLAGNRGVIMSPPVNAVRSVLNGGYPPSTAGNPRPYGMPPFAQILRDDEIALVLSYIRNAWGNRASLVTAEQVDRSRVGIH